MDLTGHRSTASVVGYFRKQSVNSKASRLLYGPNWLHDEVRQSRSPRSTVVILSALLLCSIVGISDGDTVTARCKTDGTLTTIRVRLAEIDAPEKAQPFGRRSKQHLSDICLHMKAEVRPVATDRFGRTVAHVACNRIDASAEQVRAGMAWVFVRYAAKRSPLRELERVARSARVGLWVEHDPVPPWDWRRAAQEQ